MPPQGESLAHAEDDFRLTGLPAEAGTAEERKDATRYSTEEIDVHCVGRRSQDLLQLELYLDLKKQQEQLLKEEHKARSLAWAEVKLAKEAQKLAADFVRESFLVKAGPEAQSDAADASPHAGGGANLFVNLSSEASQAEAFMPLGTLGAKH